MGSHIGKTQPPAPRRSLDTSQASGRLYKIQNWPPKFKHNLKITYLTAYSGLTAFVITDPFYRKLTAFVDDKVRKLLKGSACIKTLSDGVVHHRSIPSSIIKSNFGIASPLVELRTQRLKMLQTVRANV